MFLKMFILFFLSLLLTAGAQKSSVKEGPDPSAPTSSKPLHCGVPQQPLLNITNNDGRVARGQFPWAVAIYRENDEVWSSTCSGTLISARIVLTAAYCVSSYEGVKVNASDIKVGLGKQNKNFDSNEADTIIANVTEVVVPRNFHGVASNLKSNVALLKLAVSVKSTPYINPACLLPETNTKLNLDNNGYIAGWFENKNDSEKDVLQVSKMELFSIAACIPKLPDAIYIRFLMADKICAEQISGAEADQGFSGAALTSVSQGVHYVVGVLSGKLTMTTNNTGLYLLTDMKYNAHDNWLRSEMSRLE